MPTLDTPPVDPAQELDAQEAEAEAAAAQEQQYAEALTMAQAARAAAPNPAGGTTAVLTVAKQAAAGDPGAAAAGRSLWKFYGWVASWFTLVWTLPAAGYLAYYFIRSKFGSKKHPMGTAEALIVIALELATFGLVVLVVVVMVIVSCVATKPLSVAWDVFWGQFPKSCFSN